MRDSISVRAARSLVRKFVVRYFLREWVAELEQGSDARKAYGRAEFQALLFLSLPVMALLGNGYLALIGTHSDAAKRDRLLVALLVALAVALLFAHFWLRRTVAPYLSSREAAQALVGPSDRARNHFCFFVAMVVSLGSFWAFHGMQLLVGW